MKKIIILITLFLTLSGYSQNFSFDEYIMIKTKNISERDSLINYLVNNNFNLTSELKYENNSVFEYKIVNEIPLNYTKDSLLINSPSKYNHTEIKKNTQLIINVNFKVKMVSFLDELNNEEKVYDFKTGLKKISVLKNNIICQTCNKTVDEFDGSIKWDVGQYNNTGTSIRFIKYKEGKSFTYYLSIYQEVYSPTTYAKGVSLILSNGNKMFFPNALVKSSYMANGFNDSTFIQLSQSDLIKLKQSNILKFKLYITKGEISLEESKELLTNFNCLILTK